MKHVYRPSWSCAYFRTTREACRKLFTAQEQVRAELEIAADPSAWPVIAGTGGVRQARAARGGHGKSGGARILTFVFTRRGTIYPLFAKGRVCRGGHR